MKIPEKMVPTLVFWVQENMQQMIKIDEAPKGLLSLISRRRSIPAPRPKKAYKVTIMPVAMEKLKCKKTSFHSEIDIRHASKQRIGTYFYNMLRI